MRRLTQTGSQYSGFFDIPILRRPINKCMELVRRYSVVSVSSLENRSIAQFHVTSRVRLENYEQLHFNQGYLFIKMDFNSLYSVGKYKQCCSITCLHFYVCV